MNCIFAMSRANGICRKCGRAVEPYSMSRVRCCECAEITRCDRLLQHLGTCAYCGEFDRMTRDHIIPRSVARDLGKPNIALVCRDCNTRKGDKLLEEWLAQLPADAPQHIYAARFVQ